MDPTNEGPRASRGPKTRIAAPHGDKDFTTAPSGGSQRDRARGLLTALRLEYRVLGEHLPLKLGTRSALHALLPGVSRKLIGRALRMHSHGDLYLKALAAAGPRFALDGTPCGEVSEEHQAAAVLRLQRLAEKAQPSRPSPPKVPPAAKAPNPPTPSASAFSIGARAVLSLKSRRRP